MVAQTKPKKKVRIEDISKTRTRRTSSAMSTKELGEVEGHRRMTADQRKAYLKRRKQIVLHPDDWDFAKKQKWTEGEEYIMSYKAKRLKLGNTDGGEEE